MNKKEIQELMLSRGYGLTAESSNENVLHFLKTKNNIIIQSLVNLKNESLIIKVSSNLKLGSSISSGIFYLEDFDKYDSYEQQIYRYAYVCGLEDKKEDQEKEPEKTIKERKEELWEKIRQYGKEKQYSKEVCLAFFDYWTQKNPQGKKMRFEMEKVFDVPGRLRTWISNEKKFSKTVVDKKADKQDEELKKQNKLVNPKDLF